MATTLQKSNGRLSADDIKCQASGRWPDILRAVCGLEDRQLNPRLHGPCPKCGGADRFRALDDVAETGGLFCNQCFSKNNADGFSVIQWMNGVTFQGSLKLVADYLGHRSGGHPNPSSRPESKPKTIHPTPEKAADAIAWGMAQDGTLTPQRKPDSGWRYHNADGSDSGAVFRWNLPDGRKEIRQVSKVEGGWVASAMPEPRPLYRLPELIESPEVWIFEGEKSVDVAIGLGLVATTSAGGSNASEKSDWSVLEGKTVYVLPDNDEAGEKYATKVIELLRRQAPNAIVEVKRLADDWPELPEAGDIADWSENFDGQDTETLQARLQELPDRCGEYGIPEEEAIQNESESFSVQSAWNAIRQPKPMREVVIEGMARRGEVVNIVASTKVGKSWLALSLLFSIATGRDWLGRKTKKGRVLLIDNELHDETLQNRMTTVAKEMRIYDGDVREPFDYVVLRGQAVSISDIEKQLSSFNPGELTAVVLDAKYRFFGNGMQENSNDDQTTFHNAIDMLAKQLDCVVCLVHHATKGSQSDKAVTDIGAGGGSQSRTVDCHMVLRPHSDGDDLAVLDAAVRTFPPIVPCTIRWKFPLWQIVTDVEPSLKQAQTRNEVTVERSQKTKISTILDMLKRSPNGIETENKLSGNNPSRTAFRAALNELESSGEIVFVPEYTPPRRTGIAPAWKLAEGSQHPTSIHTPHL